MQAVKLFFLLYVVVVAIIYSMARRTGPPWMLPGDFYRVHGPNRIYLPFGTSLIINIILFIILYSFIR
ncbi:hypothetical protein A2955_00320 [Candidatus Woesebacteria bacterium RIFCSPLOWO2_01_FULL_37_19]|uniref:DUF2905 domain-containing protein n=1 Tax=Candidatus Woesebacteria bacterium RIFCSPLOWO2_01_FULL_37_19 TaxID=1802514 RepID=A0A1F8BBT2_9BACT|nr:MAG: hypothetical protein A2955_00320 [Candidatus Woesebacteria bacterium RIFCSPLOWO2_01_FULL_37_19]